MLIYIYIEGRYLILLDTYYYRTILFYNISYSINKLIHFTIFKINVISKTQA